MKILQAPSGLENGFIGMLAVLTVVIALWFVLRQLVCWYYKINERIELQKRTNELLEKLIRINTDKKE